MSVCEREGKCVCTVHICWGGWAWLILKQLILLFLFGEDRERTEKGELR